MAQSYVTDQGITLVNPGTYVTTTVVSSQGQIAQAGVMTLVGEADQGPDWTQETDLSQNVYTPSQFNQVLAKYQSGNLVDGFRAAVSAANDPSIVGAVSQIYLVKTNVSTAASSQINRSGFGGYAKLGANLEGAPGNLINYTSQVAQAEAAPETPVIAYCPQYDEDLTFGLRANGGALLTVSLPTRSEASALLAQLTDYVKGIMPSGGIQYAPLTGLGSGSITISAAPVANFTNRLQITLQAGSVFNPAPNVGDTILIVDSDYGTSHASAIKGTGGVNNAGSYVVVSVVNTVSNASITVQRINGETGAVTGAASGTINAAADDILGVSQLQIENITGMDRQATVGLSGTFNCTSNNGTAVVLQSPLNWAAQPVVGDYLVFATTFAGINAGFYQVTNSSANTVSFTIISNGSSGITGSQNVASPITQGTQPFLDEKPVIDGLGKSLEIVGEVEEVLINPNTYAGAGLSNELLVSAAEYENSFTVAQGTNSSTYTSGGIVALEVGCSQLLAQMVVGPTGITFKVDGQTIFSATYAQYPTLSQLAAYINSQSTFYASVPQASLGNNNPNMLDEGTFGISSGSDGNLPGRIKEDAISFMNNVDASALANITLLSFSGLPEAISPPVFLANGAKGGTTSAQVTAAIDACARLTTNFVNTLFSQDASKDIAAGLTDPSSTYTIAAINAYLQAHVIEMSQVLMRKNRAGFASLMDSYKNVVQAVGNIAAYRLAMCFQPVMNVNSSGVIQTYQPWMAGIIAAGMQAAAGYKGIVKKFANISGYLDPVDFDSTNPGDTQEALQAGLLFLEKVPTGGFRWLSDQTTYSIDNNFVYNSLQAVYLADLMTLSLIDTFDKAVVGKSIAQVSASAALGILSAEMFDFLRLKWIAPSTDAPKGYKNASATFANGAMQISCEAKLAGLIYFVPINFMISEVTQTASSATGT